MARFHGKSGRVYIAKTSGGSAEPMDFISSWTMDLKADRVDVTAFGDTNKVYVQSFSDAQGTFDGFRNAGALQLITAAQDGLARKVYFYEDASDNTKYWFNTSFIDFSTAQSVSDAAKASGSWASATPLAAVGMT